MRTLIADPEVKADRALGCDLRGEPWMNLATDQSFIEYAELFQEIGVDQTGFGPSGPYAHKSLEDSPWGTWRHAGSCTTCRRTKPILDPLEIKKGRN